ncbi:hypothetical protein OIU76_021837 [Salix suchowensis]|nr:hypothetical protein OIU76_021837 [Salix suchowensis]
MDDVSRGSKGIDLIAKGDAGNNHGVRPQGNKKRRLQRGERTFMSNLPFPNYELVGVVMESNNQQGEPICRGGESSNHPKEEGRHL